MATLTETTIRQSWRRVVEVEPMASLREVCLIGGPEQGGETDDLIEYAGRDYRVTFTQGPRPRHVGYLHLEMIAT